MTIESKQTADEAQIRFVLDEFANALQVKDRNKIVSLYAPEVVTFDVVPPLAYAGISTYEKSFQRMFAAFQGPIEFDTRHLRIAVDGDVAFSHSLIRTSGTLKNGRQLDRWLRRTVCLRKTGGQWLIAHEHISLPVAPETGSAVQDLQP